MLWSLPLTAASTISSFSSQVIESHSNVQYVQDDSSVVWPWMEFKTSPHTPPHMDIRVNRQDALAPGYIFFDPSDVNNADGTEELSGTGFVMTTEGELVFAGLETGMNFCHEWTAGMTDFRAQTYNGKKYITYWNGCNTLNSHWGHRWGRVTFIDEEYTNFTINPELQINTLDSAPIGQIDVHEHQMTHRNTMLVTSYNNTQVNISALGGPEDAWVADCLFYEIDIETQNVVFLWRAMDHIPLEPHNMGWTTSGGATHRAPWDWFHINSVQLVGDNYLVSARHHWAVYLIDGKTGDVLWKLHGIDGGDFGSIPAKFRWQHHARATNVTEDGMTVSLFNNKVSGDQVPEYQTEGVAYWLPLPANKTNPPVLVRNLTVKDRPIYSGTQGSYTIDLGNGNGFVGYGLEPVAREFSPSGELLWEGKFGGSGSVQSYRVFKDEWHGTPKHWDPALVVERVRSLRQPQVYVSWNGATDLSGWAVFAGPNADQLSSMGTAPKQGFETVFELPGHTRCVQVGAIRAQQIIRLSNVACLY